MNNPLDLFAWKVRSERKRQHLTQKQLAERLGMNPRTIIDLETCQSNPKFETVVLVAKELNISVDAAIFPEMVNQTVSKTVVDFFAGKSEAEIEKFIALCKQAEAFQSHDHPLSGWHVLPLEGDITCLRPEGALKSANCTTFTAAPKLGAFSVLPYSGVASKEACWFALTSYFRSKRDLLIVFLHRLTRERVDILY